MQIMRLLSKSGISRIIFESMDEHNVSNINIPEVKEPDSIDKIINPIESRITQLEQKLKLMSRIMMTRNDKVISPHLTEKQLIPKESFLEFKRMISDK